MGKIVIVGSINMDYTALLEELPNPGETLMAKGFKMSGGGKGANQAMAAAIFSKDVLMVGCLGDDPAGHALYEKIKNKGIDMSCVEFTQTPTGNALIYVAEQGKNTIVVYPGANQDCTPAYVEKYRSVIEKASLVMMQLEIPMETVEYVADIAYKANVPILLNPAPANTLSDELISKITYLTPNETELLRITNQYDAKKGGIVLQEMGVKNIIVTLGSNGCYMKTEKEEDRIPTFKVNAIDTTAAGDSFSGALAAHLAKGYELKEALKIANATGALTTTKIGAQEALPTEEEVHQLIKSQKAE